MSDPNDVWQNSAPAGDNYSRDRDGSPRRDGGASPRRDRSRSPARNGNGNGDRGRSAAEGPDVQNQGNNLHVSGLAKVIDVKYLDDLFGKHGQVQKAEVMFDPHTQESRGFGFVKMMTSNDANAAIEALNGQMFEGKSMTVAHARRGRARTPTPGQYHGVKVERGPPRGGYGGGGGYDRPYQPRSYDSRYAERGPPPRYDDRRDDRRYDDRRYDDRRDYGRDRYDDHARAPPVGGDRVPSDRNYYPRSDRGGYDRPRYDDRPPRDDRPRYDEPKRYDERPRY